MEGEWFLSPRANSNGVFVGRDSADAIARPKAWTSAYKEIKEFMVIQTGANDLPHLFPIEFSLRMCD